MVAFFFSGRLTDGLLSAGRVPCTMPTLWVRNHSKQSETSSPAAMWYTLCVMGFYSALLTSAAVTVVGYFFREHDVVKRVESIPTFGSRALALTSYCGLHGAALAMKTASGAADGLAKQVLPPPAHRAAYHSHHHHPQNQQLRQAAVSVEEHRPVESSNTIALEQPL